MLKRLMIFVVPALAIFALASVAYGNPSGQTDWEQTEAAGWDCTPKSPIAGQYLHCAPPGKPSVTDIVSSSGSTVPSIPLRVFNVADESFAGIESLIRADLYRNQPCPQDAGNLPGGKWSLLELPSGNNYNACHRFERTSTS